MIRYVVGMALALAAAGQANGLELSIWSDPLTRYFHVTYPVPDGAPDEVLVRCAWSPAGADTWRPARVMPLISETALRLVPTETWTEWESSGLVRERRATGLERTVVFNPYPEAQIAGRVDVDFRVTIHAPDETVLAAFTTRLQADHTDVVYVEDWSQVFQQNDLTVDADDPDEQQWLWRTGMESGYGVSLGNALYGDSGKTEAMPQLSYPLDLKGWYAVYAHVPGVIQLRLTGDERDDMLSSRRGEEVLWRWVKMDRQNLVIKQSYNYQGCVPAMIDYVKFVPLTEAQRAALDAPYSAPHDKYIAAYWEPYSYAFSDNVQDTLWHREYLTAYPEARVDLVDMQIGRFGMKVVYESRLTENLYHSTIGDPIGDVAQPLTDNVGRMQQFTNTLDTSVRHAQELGVQLHANFGASNCYPGTPLQGQFSKDHPEWMRGSALRFEVPEVREHALSLYRESLEIGAKGLSIDFCRYPETIDVPETANTFLKDLRALAEEFGVARGAHVPILVRFPAHGVRLSENFDYATWAREGWVDYLCPSNIQGRHHHFDVTPYLAAVAHTKSTVLPCIDALSWGPPLPGPFLWRAAQLYETGVTGLYIYQADARVLGTPNDRRTMRLLGSSEAVKAWWAEDARLRSARSKGIYITPPEQVEGYHGWHRLRVWTEGVAMGTVEYYLDGALVDTDAGPPYVLGTEEYESDGILPAGDHKLRIRAKDGDGWLEQVFQVGSAG